MDNVFEKYAEKAHFHGFMVDDFEAELEDLPGSLCLDEETNKTLRMPNKAMQTKSQVELNRMLFRIRSEPRAFKELIEKRRLSSSTLSTTPKDSRDFRLEEETCEGILEEEEEQEEEEQEEQGKVVTFQEFETVEEEYCSSSDESNSEDETEEDRDSQNGVTGTQMDDSDPVVDDKNAKENLDKYSICYMAGKGSFSSVYCAKQKSSSKLVALKCVRFPLGNSASTKSKCIKEIQILQSVNHQNIISCDTYFECPQGLFIVLEWAAGGDLKRMLQQVRLKRSRFDEKVVWTYFLQISNGVQFMHSKNLIHRDIKPANIFIFPDGNLKLGDLGLTRALSHNTLKAYSRVGTPLYMPPEVLQGRGQDYKSDIWSLGCVLYEMAMLHSPFEVGCKTMRKLFLRIMAGEYFAVSSHYSEQFHYLVKNLLSVSSSDRFDASEVCNFSEAQLNHLDNGGPNPSLTRPREPLSPTPKTLCSPLGGFMRRASHSLDLPATVEE